MNLWGITGRNNSGKTRLIDRLVTEFASRGLVVSTVKQVHHAFDVDRSGTDSIRHRQAGASEVFLSSRKRWALMHENRSEGEAALGDLLAKLSPVDLVLIEGFEREDHPKIEAHRGETGQPLTAHDNNTIKAIASDSGAQVSGRPTFDLNDTAAIAEFIQRDLNL